MSVIWKYTSDFDAAVRLGDVRTHAGLLTARDTVLDATASKRLEASLRGRSQARLGRLAPFVSANIIVTGTEKNERSTVCERAYADGACASFLGDTPTSPVNRVIALALNSWSLVPPR